MRCLQLCQLLAEDNPRPGRCLRGPERHVVRSPPQRSIRLKKDGRNRANRSHLPHPLVRIACALHYPALGPKNGTQRKKPGDSGASGFGSPTNPEGVTWLCAPALPQVCLYRPTISLQYSVVGLGFPDYVSTLLSTEMIERTGGILAFAGIVCQCKLPGCYRPIWESYDGMTKTRCRSPSVRRRCAA